MRLLFVVLGIASCLFAIRTAAIFGFSRLLVIYSLGTGNVAAAKKASQLTSKDAEAHVGAAAVLSAAGTPDQSVVELERAVALRPDDYELWSELGLIRDQTGDSTGALAAFDEAIKRAPYYSQPRWNRGNVLLRKGEFDAAFSDLNQAAKSNPELVPNLIDLAWSISKGDVKSTEQLAQIDSDKLRISFARFLAGRGKAKEAIAELGDARNAPERIRREMVDQMLAKGAFPEAFQIWQVDRGFAASKNAGPAIYDGGFEGPLTFDASGFEWRVQRELPATSIVLDSSEPHSGTKNLRVEFNGDSNPALDLISQIFLVEPSRRYKINFTSRSQQLVTGGLPHLVISDAAGNQKRLGQSAPLTKGTSGWQFESFEFTTDATTTAVVLSLQRLSCSTLPCPIFGSISLDSFSVEQLK